MSYNLKNKNIVVLALSFAVMMTMSNMTKAQDAPFLFDEPVAEDAAVLPNQQDDVAPIDEKAPIAEENNAVEASDTEIDTSFLDEQSADEAEPEIIDEQNNVDEALLADEEANVAEDGEDESVTAPSSPFENFGNAILSKVDNDLFNQMSQIEKQTTLLNLELKREDVRNKVEALKAARLLARQEAESRRIAEEEKLKDMEVARQQKIIEAQAKVKEKEIELEKVRQAKVLNDYMNEVLVINQKWIEKNGKLQVRINELENERQELINAFEEKIEKVKQKTDSVNKHATDAVERYTNTTKNMNAQVMQLRRDIAESEARIQMMKEQSSGNPFANGGNLDPNAASIDLAQEYAIMDITGQGDDIVAKIVSRDGTTFTVHRGSVLHGGETVLKITEKYIAFDKKGIKSYLYPGGTIMEYEPRNIFNESEKTPEATVKKSIRNETPAGLNKPENETVFGKPMNQERESTVKKKAEKAQKQGTVRKSKSLSFSQGMFAY
ncbi:MAG: hypothetical protein IJ099_04375 [Alphaproteobacteria bacterium]|nr:hypothetical protein [Alphaproteobacteria bacterium]